MDLDPRGTGVEVLVDNAVHAVWLARVGEAFVIGAAAGTLVAAAAVASGASLGRLDAWGVALLSALCASSSWLIEKRPGARGIAAQIDTHLRQNGGFLTAFEVERDLREGRAETQAPLARLLVRRVRERVGPREVVRASLPNSIPLLALPFVAAALLASALDARTPAPDVPPSLAALSAGLAEELRDVQDLAFEAPPGELPEQTLERVLELAREARAVAVQARNGAAPGAAEVPLPEIEGALSEIADGVDELRRELAAEPGIRSALERAAGFVDAALAGSERAENALPSGSTDPSEDALATAGEPSEGEPTRGSAGVPGAEAGGTEGSGSGSGGAESGQDPTPKVGASLEIPAGDGTMLDRPDPTEVSAAPTSGRAGDFTVPGPGPIGGVHTGRWWPQQHAGVVGRWVEARRAARAASDTVTRPAGEALGD